jgi:hypothetical protein
VILRDDTEIIVPTGTTVERPSPATLYQRFLDTDLGYEIWWTGTNWITSTPDSIYLIVALTKIEAALLVMDV